MQGDYMTLRYAFPGAAAAPQGRFELPQGAQPSGILRLTLDARGLVQHMEVENDQSAALRDGEGQRLCAG